MPGVVRKGDFHVGHASPTPNPFHRTAYAAGSPTVFANGRNVQRIGDETSCTDKAATGSPNVYANGIKVHRLGDATTGHQSWVPNAAATSSTNVFCNGSFGEQGVAVTITPIVFFGNPILLETPVAYTEDIRPVTPADVPADHPYTQEQVDPGTEPPKPAVCGAVPFVNPYDTAVAASPGPVWAEKWKTGGTNPMIKGLWDEIGYDGSRFADETAWCAVFTGAILKRSGCKYIKTASSQAYATYGSISVDLADVRKGDIVVFYRKGPSSGLGHVGFATGNKTATTIEILGGNQGDTLSVRSFKLEDIAKGWGIKAIRRPVSCVDGTTPAPAATAGTVASSGSGGSVT